MNGNSFGNEIGSGATNVTGGNLKLRAACDACNESKVRCSQTKPTCVRCEKHGITCVYGLSRRSHKDAPRIMSSANRLPSSSLSPDIRHNPGRSSRGDGQHSNHNYNLPTPTSIHLPYDSNFLGSQDQPQQQQGATSFNGNLHQLPAHGDAAVDLEQGADGLKLGALFSLDQVELAVASAGMGDQHTNPLLSLPNSVDDSCSWIGLDPNADNAHPSSFLRLHHEGHHSDQRGHFTEHRQGHCSCDPDVVPNLVRKERHVDNHAGKRLRFDVRLSRLKEAIMACEASVACQHHSSDLHITMILGVHIGSIIDGFEILVTSESRPSSSSEAGAAPAKATKGLVDGLLTPVLEMSGTSSASDGSDTVMSLSALAPDYRMSWGVLKLEEAEEMEICHRLCLVYFRRLRGLLSHFDQSVRVIRDAQCGHARSRSSAYVMAYEYMRLWLEQKAAAVEESFSNRDGEAAG